MDWRAPPARRARGAGPRSSTPYRSAAAACCWRRPRWPGGPACRWPSSHTGCPPGWLRHGVDPPPAAEVERVHFLVDTARHRAGVPGFGAAAPLMHPATGFSVAATLRLAPVVADALAAHLPGDPRGALAAARLRGAWPPAAQAVHMAAPPRAGGSAAHAPGGGPRVLRGLSSLSRTPPVGLPHRPRRPPGDGRRHERAVRPRRVAAAPAPRRPRHCGRRCARTPPAPAP